MPEPTTGLALSWWITTDFFRNGGEVYNEWGPFASQQMAMRVRDLIEDLPLNKQAGKTFAVDNRMTSEGRMPSPTMDWCDTHARPFGNCVEAWTKQTEDVLPSDCSRTAVPLDAGREPSPDVVWEVVGEGTECPVCSHDASEHEESVGCLVGDGDCECPLAPVLTAPARVSSNEPG
jgi:hypothetical protein